jgi:hypothetical protein
MIDPKLYMNNSSHGSLHSWHFLFGNPGRQSPEDLVFNILVGLSWISHRCERFRSNGQFMYSLGSNMIEFSKEKF